MGVSTTDCVCVLISLTLAVDEVYSMYVLVHVYSSVAPTSSAHFHARSTATIITKYQEKRILSMPPYRMLLALSKIVFSVCL